MSRPEYTGERDLSYSRWHRSLENAPHNIRGLYSTNIDFIEYRYINGKFVIVAVIEEKDDRGTLSDTQKEVMLKVANALNVPCYFVRHNCCKRFDKHSHLFNFRVEDLNEEEVNIANMNEEKYINWLKNLGK